MAIQTPVDNEDNSDEGQYTFQWKKDYEEDWGVHRLYVQNFDSYEAMLVGLVYDSVSNSVDGSKITDSYSATLALERAARVMGKLPEGLTESMAKADQGKAALMDIIRQKWLYPNANAQHDFKTKLRLWQLYSDVYGYMPMFYDWNIAPSGYVGPDCWLWSPRNLVPQQGRTSISDMDYVTALTWVGKNYLEECLESVTGKESDGSEDDDAEEDSKEVKEDGGWDKDALELLLEKVQNESQRPEQQKDTVVMRQRTPSAIKRGIQLATRYEAGDDGEWITFAPDHGYLVVRRLKNPHKNGRIPFVIKYSQPLFDSFYGLGDFQRSKPLQFARDGLTNFYFKGIKMNLIPPLIANANGVLKHTLDYREGAVMLETIPNSIRRLETSTAGLATYQGAQTALTGSLLALWGSQNADASAAGTLNPSQGKTPAAINLYGDKEADRDGQERTYLESAIQELTNGFYSLLVNIGVDSIPINLFAKDIEEIRDGGLADVIGLFTKNFKPNDSLTGGQLKIDPKTLKDLELRFQIEPNSTAQMNKDQQRQALEDFIGVIGKLQNVIQNDPTVKVEWDNIMKTYQSLTDIEGVEKFITVNPDAKPAPQPTQVQTPGGQVHDVADLTKLFLGIDDLGVKNSILQMIGLPPMQAPVQQPTTISSGHSFNDPSIAAAAESLVSGGGQMLPAPTTPAPAAPTPVPTVTKGGRLYHDPVIAKSAEAIEALK